MFDRESRRERRMYGFGLGILLLFIVSGVQSCTEIKYSIWGETTLATIRGAQEDEGRIVVEYFFEDQQGKGHRGKSRLSRSRWRDVEAATMDVVYMPDRPERSTLATCSTALSRRAMRSVKSSSWR